MNTQKRLDKADQFIVSGDYPAAINLYTDIIDDDPECNEAWLMLGSLYGETGELEKAIEHIEKAIHIDPDDSHAYLALGQIKNAAGDYDTSMYYFQKALECDSENTDVLCTLASLHLQQGEASIAIKLFEKATYLDDSLVSAWTMLGPLYFQENNMEEAEKCFKKTLSFQSAGPVAFIGYCGLLNALDRSDEALTLINSLPDHIQSSPEVQYQLSSAYLNEGLNVNAMNCIDEAIKSEPQEKYILSKINILQTMGDFEEAFQLLKPYLEANPPNATAAIILSKFCKSVDLENECLQLLNRVYTEQQLSPYVKRIVENCIVWLK